MFNVLIKKLSTIIVASSVFLSMSSNVANSSLHNTEPEMLKDRDGGNLCVVVRGDIADKFRISADANIADLAIREKFLTLTGYGEATINDFTLEKILSLPDEVLEKKLDILHKFFPTFAEFISSGVKKFLRSPVTEPIAAFDPIPLEVVQANIDLAYVRFAKLCGFAKLDKKGEWVIKDTSSREDIDSLMSQKSYKNLWIRIRWSVEEFVEDRQVKSEIYGIIRRYYGL